MSETFTYTLNDGGTADEIVVTVSTPATNATGYGPSFGVTSVTGFLGAATITGESGPGNTLSIDAIGQPYDNAVFPSPSDGDGSSFYGVDGAGIEFTVGSDLYSFSSFGSSYILSDETTGDISNAVLVSTDAPCYCPGTLILTDGGERLVESLAIGDTVVTAAGKHRRVRWIGTRSYGGPFLAANPNVQPVRFRAGSLGAGLPRRDLLVSPEHAMFLDGVLVPARLLVNGQTVVREADLPVVAYFHVELDTHDVLLAEGAPSESFVDCDSRGLFQNAHTATHATDAPRWSFCAPRVEEGERLEAIKRAIDLRAGLCVPGLGERLRGAVDALDSLPGGRVLRGWAQNPERPEVPVCLEVLVDGRPAGRTLANLFRGDLRAAGMGSGRHAFRLELAVAVRARTVEVRRVSDGWSLGTLQLRPAPRRRVA